MREDDEITGVFEPDEVVELPPEERALVIAGRYEIVERIGAGGMGQVLHVRHRRLGKSFALKLMLAEFSLDPQSREVFHREARLASALDHPSIVSIVDFGEDPDWGLFIVMEFLEGDLLSSRIEETGPLPVPVVCDVSMQLASALGRSHANHVVHGDLKPDNVLCLKMPEEERRQWNVKLLDYGTAHLLTGPADPRDRLAGTPEYVAPERISGGDPQPSVDIYALGVLMYEMLTGSVPFSGGEPESILHRHLTESPGPPGDRRGEAIDPALVAIVDRALAKSPADRYPDARGLARELRGYMDGLGLGRRETQRRPVTQPGQTREDTAAAAFDALGVPAAGISAEGQIVVANARFARLVKHGVEDLEGVSLLDTPLAELHPNLRDDLRLVAMDGKIARRRVVFRNKSGRVTMRLLMTPATGGCGSCMLLLHPIPGPA